MIPAAVRAPSRNACRRQGPSCRETRRQSPRLNSGTKFVKVRCHWRTENNLYNIIIEKRIDKRRTVLFL